MWLIAKGRLAGKVLTEQLAVGKVDCKVVSPVWHLSGNVGMIEITDMTNSASKNGNNSQVILCIVC